MNFNYGISAALTGAAIVLVQPQIAVALTANQVNRIASEITVLVDGINPGSGVIVAKNGNTYYVLTAKHVVATEDEYAIATPDGQRYPINYSTVRKLPGVDLALLQFTSDKNYRVATLANYDYDAKFKYVFVSGWQESKLPIANRQRLFNAGLLISNDYKLAFIKDPVSDGYELFYTNITEVGMSGAPVLDMQGRVIGIHGQSEGEKIYDAKSREIYRVKLGFSSGVPAIAFLRAIQYSGIKLSLKVESSPPSQLTQQESRSIEAFLQPPTAAGSSNAVDWANRGNELYRLERFEEAIAAYDRATEIKPDFYLVWRDRGALLAFLKQDKEALASFDKAIKFKPDDYVAWYIRGDLLAGNLQRYEDAIASYDKAIKIKSDFAPAWISRGEALYDLRRYQDAIASLDKAIEIDPKQEEAWILKGTLLLELERYSEALLAYDKSVAIAPENYQLWMLRAAALLGLKRDSEARKSAQQALKLKPNDRDILNFIDAVASRSSTSTSANSVLNRRRYERSNPPKPAPDLLW